MGGGRYFLYNDQWYYDEVFDITPEDLPYLTFGDLQGTYQINYKKGKITIDGKEYQLLENYFPTIDPDDPYKLNEKEEEVILDGNTITNSEYRVAIAQIKDGSDTEDKWVEFNEAFTYFEGKVYDSSKKYKIAIVCSSSKAGDSFKGAVNSTLFVDELEIIGE